jgi:hypothetical protein
MMVFSPVTDSTNVRVVRIQPLSDKIKNLQIISCDICNGRKASYDVFIEGIVGGITFLKRYCESCLKPLSIGNRQLNLL